MALDALEEVVNLRCLDLDALEPGVFGFRFSHATAPFPSAGVLDSESQALETGRERYLAQATGNV